MLVSGESIKQQRSKAMTFKPLDFAVAVKGDPLPEATELDNYVAAEMVGEVVQLKDSFINYGEKFWTFVDPVVVFDDDGMAIDVTAARESILREQSK